MKRFYSSIYFLLIGLAIAIFGFSTVQQYRLAKVAREKTIPNAQRLLVLDEMLAEVHRIENETENYPILVESGPTGDGYGIGQQFSYLSMMEMAGDLPVSERHLMNFTQYRQNQFPISYFSTAAVGKYGLQILVELQGKLPANQVLIPWDRQQREQRKKTRLWIPVENRSSYRLELQPLSHANGVRFELTGSGEFEPLLFEVDSRLKLKIDDSRVVRGSSPLNSLASLTTGTVVSCKDGSSLIVSLSTSTDQNLSQSLWNSVEPESQENPTLKIFPAQKLEW